MALVAGSRLGPYEIVGPIGAGGMGEVYRAKDTRLGRLVALKVLPADVADDPDRLARFEREAKLVSALNHPHIVTLYEVGTSEAGPYLVLENIEGRSLRELLLAGPMPVRQMLVIGAQIADGLAKAHAAGIVHRDLKPENVMVSADGFAKILDFGLAKLVWPEFDAGAPGDATTLAKETASGMVLGTVGYLSPEQAAGKAADFRADQFALGALLYELATRERPFRRPTLLESLAATIRDEPEPVRAKRPDLPTQFEWLIERCLAKDPNNRYASTKDLARDLADLRDHISDLLRAPTVGAALAVQAGRSRQWLWGAVAALILAATAVGSFVLARRTAPESPLPSYRPLTLARGNITGARFSSDGQTVYYSAVFGNEPSRIFMTHLGSVESEPLPLKLPPAILMGVSARDELAVLLTNGRDTGSAIGTLARVPALGGTPRPLVEGASYGDWAPDGDRLAVVRGDHRIEFPIGHAVSRGAMVRVSPRGDRIAVLGPHGVEIEDTDGRTVVRDTLPFAYGLAWAPDGQEVWFTGSQEVFGAERALYALSLDGRRRLLARVPGAMTVYDVARDRRSALVTTGNALVGISAGVAGQRQEQPLDLLGRSEVVGLSSDGKWLLASEYREVGRGVYFLSTDGTQRIYLPDVIASGLSADGDWALLHPQGNASRLTVVPRGTGVPRELPLDVGLQIDDTASPAVWSADRRRLFAVLYRSGDVRTARLYMYREGGFWQAITPEGSANPFCVSPDGTLVAMHNNSWLALYRTDGGPVRRLEGENGYPIQWTADGRQLLLATKIDELRERIYRRDLSTGRVEAVFDVAPGNPSGVIGVTRVLVTPDARMYVYTYARVPGTELYLAENLR